MFMGLKCGNNFEVSLLKLLLLVQSTLYCTVFSYLNKHDMGEHMGEHIHFKQLIRLSRRIESWLRCFHNVAVDD